MHTTLFPSSGLPYVHQPYSRILERKTPEAANKNQILVVQFPGEWLQNVALKLQFDTCAF